VRAPPAPSGSGSHLIKIRITRKTMLRTALSMALLGSALSLKPAPPQIVRRVAPPAASSSLSRRAMLAMPAALATLQVSSPMPPAFAAQVGGGGGGGGLQGQETLGGGPPTVGKLAPLTKGEPGPAELQRLAIGYRRLQYLLQNWEKETTVCIKGCTGKSYEGCGCTRDPVIVQAYMGYKSMEDPLFRAGDLMLRAATLVKSDDDFEKYTLAMEKWNNQADDGNVMAYVSSWGEANPGGGQDEIARYLEKSRKTVIKASDLLKEICGYLDVPL
jgi:hypothetical protein